MRRIFFSVAILSAGVLAYEILLTRLLSITQWHHFAYMIISLALLGFGASGTFLTFAARRLAARFHRAFAINAALFGVSTLLCFAGAERVPFNPLEIAWSADQLLWLATIYLLLMLPFFFAANCIALAFVTFPEVLAKTYAFDLAGAAAGCVLVLWLMWLPEPTGALGPVAACGALAAVIVAVRGAMPRWLAAGLVLAVAGGLAWAPPIALSVSPYKALEQAARVSGATPVTTRNSPLGYLNVLENRKVPFRHAPGLSLNAPVAIPEQVAVFTDAGAATTITRHDGDLAKLAYTGYTSSALPYSLHPIHSVLVLGAGGGADVLQALSHGASRITAVELNEQLVELVREDYGEFSGEIYRDPRIHLVIADARGFVARDRERYDLVQLGVLDAFGASAAGLHALNEGYLYTVEALASYLRRLKPDGLLAITVWSRIPPRDGVKLFATAIAALESLDVADPGARLAWVRSWNNSTLVIKNGSLTDDEIAGLREFNRSRSFDAAYYPGMTRSEANRYNILSEPRFFDAAMALLGPGREGFVERYKFHVSPARDDRPYFLHFFKWRHLGEMLDLRLRGGVGLLELGYLVLVAALVQAFVLGVVLVLLPLAWMRRNEPTAHAGAWRRATVVGYFLAIGLAFLFIEIAFMQTFVRFLSHPVYAIAVVLAGFLVFAALGSRMTLRAGDTPPRPRDAGMPVLVIAAICIAYTLSLEEILEHFVHIPWRWRMVVTLALIAPLATAMGMPFPVGLQSLRLQAPELVAWAWGINGCASVVSAVLAAVLAVHFGFTLVILAAVLLYLASACIGWRAFENQRRVKAQA
jgi:spermidine synthase